MSDEWTSRLSEYLDGELTMSEWSALEAHLRTCTACSAMLADLRRVVARARALEDRPVERDLWPAVAAQIGALPAARTPEPRRRGGFARRWSFSLPQLAAAALALMVGSGGTVWLLQRSPDAPEPPQSLENPAPALATGSSPLSPYQGYDAAVTDLRRVLERGRGRLDSATVRVLEQNLAAIDQAIVQAQRALEADPANLYLNDHLAETMQRRLALLRRAAQLVAAVS